MCQSGSERWRKRSRLGLILSLSGHISLFHGIVLAGLTGETRFPAGLYKGPNALSSKAV